MKELEQDTFAEHQRAAPQVRGHALRTHQALPEDSVAAQACSCRPHALLAAIYSAPLHAFPRRPPLPASARPRDSLAPPRRLPTTASGARGHLKPNVRVAGCAADARRMPRRRRRPPPQRGTACLWVCLYELYVLAGPSLLEENSAGIYQLAGTAQPAAQAHRSDGDSSLVAVSADRCAAIGAGARACAACAVLAVAAAHALWWRREHTWYSAQDAPSTVCAQPRPVAPGAGTNRR